MLPSSSFVLGTSRGKSVVGNPVVLRLDQSSSELLSSLAVVVSGDVDDGGNTMMAINTTYSLEEVQKNIADVEACSRNVTHGRRSIWNLRSRSCSIFADFVPPLRASFEISSNELSCDYDTPVTNHQIVVSGSTSLDVWHRNSNDYFHRLFARRDSANSSSSNNNNNNNERTERESRARRLNAYKMNHENFQYHTSWLFEQHLPFEALPVPDDESPLFSSPSTPFTDNATDITATALPPPPPSRRRAMRGFHDAAAENIYRLENVCISPFGGIGGFAPSRFDAFYGRDESRDKFFQLYGAKKLLINALTSPAAAAAAMPDVQYDRRPFILFDIGHAGCIDNLAHQMLRLLSLIGTLKMNPFDDPMKAAAGHNNMDKKQKQKKKKNKGQSTTTGETRRNPFGFDVKPLLVLIWRPVSVDTRGRDEGKKTPLTAAFGFYLRILDLPWASIVLPSFPVSKSATKLTMDHIWSEKKSNKRGISSSSSGEQQVWRWQHERGAINGSTGIEEDVLSTENGAMQPVLCMERGIVWQNCRSCPGDMLPFETERYSFGMFTQATPERVAIINEYRRMTKLCLRGQPAFPRRFSSSAMPQSSSSSELALPLVFFDIRERDRFILDSAMYLDLVRRRTAAFTSGVIFAEPGQGSRSAYVQKLRASNIFIGVHGAALTGIALMPRKSVVVELSFPHHTFRCSFSLTCWFAPFSKALGPHQHFVVDVNVTYSQLPSDTAHLLGWMTATSPMVLSDAIIEASCRWHVINSQGRRDKDASTTSDDDDDADNNKGNNKGNKKEMRQRVAPGENIVRECERRGLWRKQYPLDESITAVRRIGDEQHLKDLFLVLTGTTVSNTEDELSRIAQALRDYFGSWSSQIQQQQQQQPQQQQQQQQSHLEGYPARFWTLLLQQWLHIPRLRGALIRVSPIKNKRASAGAAAAAVSSSSSSLDPPIARDGFVRIACFKVVLAPSAGLWCLYGQKISSSSSPPPLAAPPANSTLLDNLEE